MIAIVKVERIHKGSETQMSVVFESDYESIDDLLAALNAGHIVKGNHLFYDKLSQRKAVVRGRRPFIFTKKEVFSIQQPQQQFIEDGVVL